MTTDSPALRRASLAAADPATVYRVAECRHCRYEIQNMGDGWYHLGTMNYSGGRKCPPEVSESS